MQKLRHAPIVIAVVLLLALTVCGSFWDLEIAQAVYLGETPAENLFGIIFSFIGIIPTFVGWSFLGASIFYLSKTQIANTKRRRWLMAFAVLLCVLSFFYFCNTLYLSNANAFEVHFVVAYGVGLAVLFAAAYLGYLLSARSKNSELLKKVLFLAVVSLVVLLLISSTKQIMCRPRFRFVLAMEDESLFCNWWQSGRARKESLGIGATNDEFTSLPSGHSAYSMFAIFLFPALADYVDGLKKYRGYLFGLGFLWWAATALSRLTIGAHYLTDVTIAGLVTMLACLIVSAGKKLICKHEKT